MKDDIEFTVSLLSLVMSILIVVIAINLGPKAMARLGRWLESDIAAHADGGYADGGAKYD